MKKLLLALVACLGLTGCIGTAYAQPLTVGTVEVCNDSGCYLTQTPYYYSGGLFYYYHPYYRYYMRGYGIYHGGYYHGYRGYGGFHGGHFSGHGGHR